MSSARHPEWATPKGATWRVATAADLASIQRIGNAIHTDLPERPEIFAEKLKLFPEGCFVLTRDETVVGYGLCHPWRLNSIPPLNQFLGRLPSEPDCLLIHDAAILPEARGQGATAVLVELVTKLAQERKIARLALVSVYGSYVLWARFGFEIVSDTALADKLRPYGKARYMVCPAI
jgi:hypothetical protein